MPAHKDTIVGRHPVESLVQPIEDRCRLPDVAVVVFDPVVLHVRLDHQIVPQTFQIADPGDAQKLVRLIQIRRQDFVRGVFFMSVDIDFGVPERSAKGKRDASENFFEK